MREDRERHTETERQTGTHTHREKEREREIVRASPGPWCLPERLALLFQIMFC